MMRSMRALLGVCVFVVAGLIAISTFSSNPPATSTALHSLVTQTHHQLNQLHKLKEELEGEQPLDNTILTDLGFVDDPIVYPRHSWSNISTPVIVTAITSRQLDLLSDFIQIAQVISVNVSVVIYSLDLTKDEIDEGKNECNDSCEVMPFDFSRYPGHVKDFHLGAYRPIIIQEMLQRSGIVFWLDPCMKLLENSVNLTHGSHSLLELWTKRAIKNGGVIVWPLLTPAPHLPTAALTHPDMFPAFRTYKHNYDFQQMSDPKATLIINSPIIHRHLMRPWVSCALTSSCLSPIGAQDTGCKYNKKPLFRYSGCHLYDTSAFNVALGLTFGMDNDSYLDSSTSFICITDNEASQSHNTLNSIESSSSYGASSFSRLSPPSNAAGSQQQHHATYLKQDNLRKVSSGRVEKFTDIQIGSLNTKHHSVRDESQNGHSSAFAIEPPNESSGFADALPNLSSGFAAPFRNEQRNGISSAHKSKHVIHKRSRKELVNEKLVLPRQPMGTTRWTRGNTVETR